MELFRMILMLMIVTFHYFKHSGILDLVGETPERSLALNLIYAFVTVSVNCYVLLSGYYGIHLSIKRCVQMELQVLFYSVTIFIIFTCLGLKEVNLENIKYSFFPIMSNTWWFATVYMALMLVSPFLNIAIKKMTKQQYQFLLVVMLLFFSIAPSLQFESINTDRGFSLYQFVLLYLLSRYFALYPLKCNKYFYLTGYILLSLIMALTGYGIRLQGAPKMQNSNIVVIISSLCLFLFAANAKQWYNKAVNRIGGLVFGVYLIHDHYWVGTHLYPDILQVTEHWALDARWLYAIFSILAVFICGIIIEYFRTLLFEGVGKLIIKNKGFAHSRFYQWYSTVKVSVPE